MTVASWLVWAALVTQPPNPPGCTLPGLTEPAALPGVSFEELERRANAAWDADQIPAALRLYRAGVDLNPLWLQGRWRLALLFWLAGCDPEARDAARHLVELAPENGRAWALLGVSEYRLQRHDRALPDLSRAAALGLSKGGVGLEAQRALALLLGRRGDFESASKVLTELAREEPDDPETVTACGLVALRMPLLPAQIDPADDDLVTTAGRAACAAFSGDTEGASDLFEALVTRYPTSPGVHLAYALELSREASPRARAMLEREVELFPDNAEAQTALAFEVLDRGNPPLALAPARAGARLTPASPSSQLALGRALLATGAIEEALIPLEEAARLDPDREDTCVALALAYQRAGRPRDVERVRRKLRELYLKRGAGQ